MENQPSNPVIHPVALFRFSVLGPLVSRDKFEHGELSAIISDLASKTYNIPGSSRVHLSRQTIQNWYHIWQRGSVYALTPKLRIDKNACKLPPNIQELLLAIKQDNKSRSIRTVIKMLEDQGVIAKDTLSKATVHRFLRNNNLSHRSVGSAETIERRSFVAASACDLWQGDVLHGPSIMTKDGLRKTYLVSIMDDASRIICYSAFCFGETALDIEGVLKQALLRRGSCKKFLVDNGAAYKTYSLQGICARLGTQLIHSRPYEPASKGKLERYHRTFREQFLNEIHVHKIDNLGDLNARLWSWVEKNYHNTPHEGLDGKTPLERYREDVDQVKQLSMRISELDELFYHREKRKVIKDGTVKWNGQIYEVPYRYVHQTIILVVDPHINIALYIESEKGERLEAVTMLDKDANLNRHRQRPNTTAVTKDPHQMDATEYTLKAYKRELQLSTVATIPTNLVTDKE